MSRKLAVIAIGGNSLIKHRDKQSVEDQYLALCETMEHIADVIQQGWQVLITHGNVRRWASSCCARKSPARSRGCTSSRW